MIDTLSCNRILPLEILENGRIVKSEVVCLGYLHSQSYWLILLASFVNYFSHWLPYHLLYLYVLCSRLVLSLSEQKATDGLCYSHPLANGWLSCKSPVHYCWLRLEHGILTVEWSLKSHSLCLPPLPLLKFSWGVNLVCGCLFLSLSVRLRPSL